MLMKIIIPANTSIIGTLGKQSVLNSNYRLLNYCRIIQCDNSTYLLYNNFTKELLEISKKEREELSRNNITLDNPTDFINYLYQNWFLVPENNNDKKLCDQLMAVFSIYNKSNNKMHLYNILPTTDCNARCFYCFEHGIPRIMMSEQVAEDVAKYIIKTVSDEKITLRWFGGEPLYNIKAIDIIVDKMIENNIEFSSTMVSNGYLFDEETVKKAKNKWNLKAVQITIDGTEEIYNKTKAYIYKNSGSPYKRVMNNIKLLLDEEIDVNIRLNLERFNEENLYRLVDELYDNFGSHKYLSVYVHLLIENCGAIGVRSDVENEEMYQKLFKLEDFIKEKGFYDRLTISSKIKTSACMADDDGAVLIRPDGKLGKCDSSINDKLIGSIYDDKIDQDVVAYWKEKSEPVGLCNTCQYYPQCIRLKHCEANVHRSCDKLQQENFLRSLDRKIIKTYDRFKSS